MTADPEILDPDSRTPFSGGAPGGAQSADIVGIVERAFPGAVSRTRGLTIEVEGPHDSVRVVQTPLVTLAVFRGMRIPLPASRDEALALLQSLARGERVLVEERGAGSLRRTHLVRCTDGGFEALEDTTNDRETIARGAMRVVSFKDGARDATSIERAFVERASGGMLGRFKRKLVEKIFDKTIDAVVGAVQEKAAEAQGAVTVDDGARTLRDRNR